jgi:hypothetical protein
MKTITKPDRGSPPGRDRLFGIFCFVSKKGLVVVSRVPSALLADGKRFGAMCVYATKQKTFSEKSNAKTANGKRESRGEQKGNKIFL